MATPNICKAVVLQINPKTNNRGLAAAGTSNPWAVPWKKPKIPTKNIITFVGIFLSILIANLGPGPRDGLMTGLQRKTNLPIALVRAFLEITVVSIGWYLGGTVGIGTLLFAFGVGPAVALGLFLVNKMFS